MHRYDNPYNNRAAIDDPTKLFGRQGIIWRIYSATANWQSIAICGLPGIGKTSILKCLPSSELQQQFKHESGQDLGRCVFVYVNLEEYLLKSFEGFFETLSKFIVKQSRGRLELVNNIGKGEEGFTDILDQICEQNFHLVLLMDMFDEIVKNKQLHDILAFLRAYATTDRISYVTASIAPLYEICYRSIVDSPFFNIFYTYALEGLAHEEALKLISVPAERVGTFFTETEVAWVLKKAGLHPFFIQGVCHALFEEKLQSGNSKFDEEYFKKLASLAYKDLLPHFTFTWERLSESQRMFLQDEAQQNGNQIRKLPELSESAFFRQFVRDICHVQLFKMTIEELEKALDKIDEVGSLGETNLRLMSLVSQRLKKDITASAAEKGRVIRKILYEALEQLRDPSVRNDTDPAWQNYTILYYRYFKYHLKNEQIAARIGVSVRQYFRYRTKAIEALLIILFEMENAASMEE